MKSPASWFVSAAIGAVAAIVLVNAGPARWIVGDVAWLAVCFGAAIGVLFGQFLEQGKRLRALEQRLARLDSESDDSEHATQGPTERPADAVLPSKQDASATTRAQAASADTGSEAVLRTNASDDQDHQSDQASASGPENTEPSQNQASEPLSKPSVAKSRTSDGAKALASNFAERLGQINLPVKIGVLILFVGLVALLRHAADQGWLSMPIELRLAGIAAVGVVGLVIGWRQRHARPVFALSLQGGAIGVLVLTVFAAFRLYGLLPQTAALGLAAVLIFGGGALAVIQRSQALAVLSMLAGFAAPLLLSTDSGDPLGVFSWYAVLNLAVFAVALKQQWPLLTRLGFVATFVVGTIWGVLTWQPDNYWIAQSFLILFFALYFLLPIIQAQRGQGLAKMDVALVFALPLLAIPPQIALLVDNRFGIAFAILIAALAYLVAARLLIRQMQQTVFGQSYAVLAVGLGTLAVPFAFSGPTVVLVWAVEGAALVWFGCQQQRRSARLSGLALIGLASALWLFQLIDNPWSRDGFMINAFGLGGLALALSAWLSAWRYQVAGAGSVHANGLFAFGFVAWVLTGLVEIERFFSASSAFPALLGLGAITAAVAGSIHWNRRWASAGLACVLMLAACAWIALLPLEPINPLLKFGWAIGVALLLIVLMLDRLLGESDSNWRARISLVGHLAVVACLSRLGVFWAGDFELSEGWQALFAGLPLLGLAAVLHFRVRPPLCLSPLEATQRFRFEGLIITLLLLVLLSSLASSGDPTPLAWLPLLNPLELTQFAALALISTFTISSIRAPEARWPTLSNSTTSALTTAAVVLCLLVITAATLRSVHQLGSVAWQPDALFASDQAQASVSIVWTILGVIAWVLGSKTARPMVWRLGALLLALVLIKLILIDRHFLSNVAGILSFVAFGLLSILVGFLAPAPPSDKHDPNTQAKGL